MPHADTGVAYGTFARWVRALLIEAAVILGSVTLFVIVSELGRDVPDASVIAQLMTPCFLEKEYGVGLRCGVTEIAQRFATRFGSALVHSMAPLAR